MKEFLWGTSTSAHQTEGNNNNSDWWKWENSKDGIDKSGNACDSFNKYREDIDLAVKLGNTAIRISIEWARIYITATQVDQTAVNHYLAVLSYAKSKGLKTMVTLHHFTSPQWFVENGGWHTLGSYKYFVEFVKLCGEKYSGLVDFWITINEPQVYIVQSYILGIWPPQNNNIFKAFNTFVNLNSAHSHAYKALKNFSSSPVGIAHHIVWQDACFGNILDKIYASLFKFLHFHVFMLFNKAHLDFIGINHYVVVLTKNFKQIWTDNYENQMGWYMRPEYIEKVLKEASLYKLPLYITENGIATDDEVLRAKYITEVTKNCINSVNAGVPLKGYFYWSLLDNFEWHEGFKKHFGLVSIGKNYVREPKSSFEVYQKICTEKI